jgi:hypothetical protein
MPATNPGTRAVRPLGCGGLGMVPGSLSLANVANPALSESTRPVRAWQCTMANTPAQDTHAPAASATCATATATTASAALPPASSTFRPAS